MDNEAQPFFLSLQEDLENHAKSWYRLTLNPIILKSKACGKILTACLYDDKFLSFITLNVTCKSSKWCIYSKKVKYQTFMESPFEKIMSKGATENTPISWKWKKKKTAYGKFQILSSINTTEGKVFSVNMFYNCMSMYTFSWTRLIKIQEAIFPLVFWLSLKSTSLPTLIHPPFLFKSHQESKVVKLNGDFKRGPIFLSYVLWR